MIYKIALCEVDQLELDVGSKIVKMAANGNVFAEAGSEKAKIIEAEIKKHPTALFFRAKAIRADEPNSNGDYFSEEEIVKSYKTFEGVPFFTNHENQHIEKAKGKIVFAEWNPQDKYVYVIGFCDREAFPHICRGIEQQYITGISMGAAVDISECNICGNRAEKTEDYCWHIREKKGKKFSGKCKNVVTGEIREFNNQSVFERNYGIKFIELSAVVDPACKTCTIENIIPNGDYLKKVANLQNALYMMKTSAVEKKASQEEVDQLNQVLQTLEQISISLVQNRKQVEVEFASDLVGILSELQGFVDELVGAGYANVQSQVPGVVDQPNLDPNAPMTEGGLDSGLGGLGETAPAGDAMQATPVSATAPATGDVGQVSGSPSNALVNTPQLPISAPAKPMAASKDRLVRIAELVNNLNVNRDKISTEDDEMGKRRIISEKNEQKKIATEKLSNSWKEKHEFLEYINKVPSVSDDNYNLSVMKNDDSFIIVAEDKSVSSKTQTWKYEDLSDEERRMVIEEPEKVSQYLLNTFSKGLNYKKEGVREMSNKIEAGAKSVNGQPEVVTEKQLEEKGLYHDRTNDVADVVTEKQLDGLRKGEQEVTTEAQLEEKSNKLNPRKEVEAEVVTEKQLADKRTNVVADEVTQAQLDAQRKDNEPEVVTEKQLDGTPSPWARSASGSRTYKTAGEHMNGVVNAMADVVISTGCTPAELRKVASTLVGSTKDRISLIDALSKECNEESIDFSQRLAYWSKKNIKVASIGSKEIAETLVNSLRKIASIPGIDTDILVDAVDVVCDDANGEIGVSKAVDTKISAAEESEVVKASRKDELRNALKEASSTKEEREEKREEISKEASKKDDKLTREAERAIWAKANASKKMKKKADTLIETNFDEVGIKKDDANIKSALRAFTKGALASNNIKLASITNVTIDGETITIAVQTGDGEQSVEIPVGGNDTVVEDELIPEGDMTGEGLGNTLPPAPESTSALASDNKKIKKEAQMPSGGGISNTPGEVAGGPGAPESALPGDLPAEEPVASLTADDPSDITEEIPTAGEQQMPYAICPECGSSDVDISKPESGNVTGDCNNCGAQYEALIKKEIEFKIIKPTKSIGEDVATEEPMAPEVPALPVAARSRLDKGTIFRIASNKKKYGHVCPSCGMNQCKASVDKEAHVEYKCPSCGTDIEKNIIVNVDKPHESYMMVNWDSIPKAAGCTDCDSEIKKFASSIKVRKMVKAAAESEFPMANCMELIARKYGGNARASFGPCKGKLLAECACKELQRFGLRTVRHMEKLASAMTKVDPFDECVEAQKKNGFDTKEASTVCNCLKKKYASSSEDNIFVHAFAEDIEDGREKSMTIDDLDAMNDVVAPEEDIVIDNVSDEDVDIADVDLSTPSEETVTLEVSKETANELADAAAEAVVEEVDEVEIDVDEVDEVEVDVVDDAADDVAKIEDDIIEDKEIMAMQSNKLRRNGDDVVKVAKQLTQIENIEKDDNVPRGKATIGKEGPDNIDVSMAKPSVPRGDAKMGNEGADNIDKKMEKPDLPIDSDYIGDEKAIQKDMPAINSEIKGTVIAKGDKQKKEAKALTEVESIEHDDNVPRADAKMGQEGADNIDVPMAKPSVPRGDAKMGQEGADNIDVPEAKADVPMGDAYMGVEKSVQNGMPANNDEMLKNVQAKKDDQLRRIADARRMKATAISAKLLAQSRISEAAYEDVIDALSIFEIDKIAQKAETMYPKKVVTASVNADKNIHSGSSIILESGEAQQEEQDLASRLTAQFTDKTKYNK